jgi:hypothetical protein
MTPPDENFGSRLITVEVKLQNLSQVIEAEKKETREYREKLQDKVENLARLVMIGVGILATLQIVYPLLRGK